MKPTTRIVMTLLSSMVIFSIALADSQNSSAVANSVLMEADIAWSASVQKEDKAEFFATILEDAVLMAPHKPIGYGRDEFGGLLKLPGVVLNWEPVSAEVSNSGDLGYTFGVYELKFDGPEGEPVVDNGKYITVWKKQDDGLWKVAADMFNTSLPLAINEAEVE